MKEKIIFHVDVNNAYLSWSAILLLKNGYKIDIRNIPAVIGGDEKKRHGIVLAKSPVAKKYGIKTAETLYEAKRKCKNLLIFPPNYNWYYKKSTELYNYLSQYSPSIEKYSIDECFLDMTGTSYLYKDYISLAKKIKREIKEMYGYTVNIGIGNNRLCAKMASDFEKPDKVHTLLKDEIKDKLWPLDVGELFMCGKKTKEQLYNLNIYTIEELAHTNERVLEKHFKSNATYLKQASWGIDNTTVETKKSKRESISTTETLPFDFTDEIKLKEILLKQTEIVTRQLREQKQFAKTVAVIFKNNKFTSYSAQTKLDTPSNKSEKIYKLIVELFDKNWKQEPIRLIGVRLSDFSNNKEQQLSLFEEQNENTKDDNIQEIIDNINKKFGNNSIMSASLKKISKNK